MTNELDALDPVPDQVKLLSGTVVAIEDLKARQFFKLLRIVTHGAMTGIADLFKLDVSAEEFGTSLLTVVLLSIPDAENETLEFIQSMVKPVGLIEGRLLNKGDTERNNALWADVDRDLENPELDDLITIVEAIVKREASDIQALGKRLAAMFKLAEKTGQLKSSSPTPASPIVTSLAGSPEPSTSSPASTDGPTTTSENSPSDGSDSASQPSESAASTRRGSARSGSSGRPARSPRS